jgi:hypothetical protein
MSVVKIINTESSNFAFPSYSYMTSNSQTIFQNFVKKLYNIIYEELMICSWDLVENYLESKSRKFFLKITGEGDPTNSSQGFSYLKAKKKILKKSFDEALPRPKISETHSDMRMLGEIQLKGLMFCFYIIIFFF